jgi:hypothetical protein
MKRTLSAVALLTFVALTFNSDVSACGDKSLSAGGIRMQRAIAARYPASILIYKPSASRMDGATNALKLQYTLAQVGHRYSEVGSVDDLETSVATGRYNLVMADVADAGQLQQRLQSSPVPVVVVGVAFEAAKAELQTAEKEVRFLIKAPTMAVRYLDTIKRAVQAREDALRKG